MNSISNRNQSDLFQPNQITWLNISELISPKNGWIHIHYYTNSGRRKVSKIKYLFLCHSSGWNTLKLLQPPVAAQSPTYVSSLNHDFQARWMLVCDFLIIILQTTKIARNVNVKIDNNRCWFFFLCVVYVTAYCHDILIIILTRLLIIWSCMWINCFLNTFLFFFVSNRQSNQWQ